MKRLYEEIIHYHLKNDSQMIFLVGPRQVGKTTISQSLEIKTDHFIYLNWDITEHRKVMMQGTQATAAYAKLFIARNKKPIIVFDEIHKYSKWKNYLKGFFDEYKKQVAIIVTGSAMLNTFQRGGDSLLGRYFPYRIHPISVAETMKSLNNQVLIQKQKKPTLTNYNTLLQFGGFPEPFLKKNNQFYNRWLHARLDRLFEEDIRDLTKIQEIKQMEIMSDLIKSQISELLNRSEVAKSCSISVTTVKRWLSMLEKVYYIFTISPWSNNVKRSLLKEPKIYLWDWSELSDPGKRSENFIASHLFKAVQYWQDCGFGKFKLCFIRDKEKNEVDFLVVKNDKPWFLVEVKTSNNQSISAALHKFQQQLQAPHAFQVVINMPYTDIDCFSYNEPVIVPAQTFLSQLV